MLGSFTDGSSKSGTFDFGALVRANHCESRRTSYTRMCTNLWAFKISFLHRMVTHMGRARGQKRASSRKRVTYPTRTSSNASDARETHQWCSVTLRGLHSHGVGVQPAAGCHGQA